MLKVPEAVRQAGRQKVATWLQIGEGKGDWNSSALASLGLSPDGTRYEPMSEPPNPRVKRVKPKQKVEQTLASFHV